MLLGMAPHYAEAFTLLPGRHFGMVTDPEPRRQGQPTHCEEPGRVAWTVLDPGRGCLPGRCLRRPWGRADAPGEGPV